MTYHVERCARICHEAERVFRRHIGDFSSPPWDVVEQWQRDAVVKGVQFHFQNPDALLKASHQAWMEDKFANGWILGADLDPKLKTHPLLVDFDQLDSDLRFRFALFKSIALAYMAGVAHED